MGHARKHSSQPDRDVLAHPALFRSASEDFFVPADQVATIQDAQRAIGFDAPGATYPDRNAEGLCSIAALVHERVAHDSFSWRWRESFRQQTSKSSLMITPAARGLQLISRGFTSVTANDHETAERTTFIYDALYASIVEEKRV